MVYRSSDDHVRYIFDVDGRSVQYTAIAKDRDGIRGVEFPEEFDAFLRAFMPANGMIVRRLVRATWAHVDGALAPLPLDLLSPQTLPSMTEELREYKAMVWVKGSNEPGKRVTVSAADLDEAHRLLVEQYGDGNVFDLHNEADADRPR